MAQKRKPERVDVVIIGAGASGATAAKVLTERGMRVVALERGPWRKRESFGGDELANVNRYNLWPDPILNPRTYRASTDGETKVELFCPVPQMVGGARSTGKAGCRALQRMILNSARSRVTCPAQRWLTGRSPMRI